MLARRVAAALAATVFVAWLALCSLFVATLPWRTWDSYAYNAWPRLYAAGGGFHARGAMAIDFERPLYYFSEGVVWRVVGFHEWVGRAWSFAFTLAFMAALVALAGRGGGDRGLRRVLALAYCLLVVDVDRHAFDGLSDVPTAAALAVTALLVWPVRERSPRPVRSAAIVVAAALAALGKPSGIVGVAALALALLVPGGAPLRARLRDLVAPLAAGLALALVFDWTQARHFGMSLHLFLQNGVGAGIWAAKAAAARPDAAWGWNWLGRPLHVVLIAAVVYAAVRGVVDRHRLAALVAAPAAWAWSLAGPAIAGDGFHVPGVLPAIATVVVAAALPLAALAPVEAAPTQESLRRLLVWAAPAVFVWAYWSAYDTRLVSAAWAPLGLLVVELLALVAAGASQVRPAVALLPAAAVLVLVVCAFADIDGLGSDGLTTYRHAGIGGLSNARLMENIALGQFQYELDAFRREVRPGERIVGADSRLEFFYPARLDAQYAKTCAQAESARAFVMLLSDESLATAAELGAPTDPEYWKQCRRLREAAAIPGVFVVYVTGQVRGHPTPAECGLQKLPPGIYLSYFKSARRPPAAAALARAQHVGFVQTALVQTGCNRWQVLQRDIASDQVAAGIVAEAKPVGFQVTVEHIP